MMITFLMRHRKVYALLLSELALLCSAEPSNADHIILNNFPGMEVYAGRVVSADKNSILFDVECSGRQVSFSWSDTKSPRIRFNNECNKKINIVITGWHRPAKSKRQKKEAAREEREYEIYCKNAGKFHIRTQARQFYVDDISYAQRTLTARNRTGDLVFEANNDMLLEKTQECD